MKADDGSITVVVYGDDPYGNDITGPQMVSAIKQDINHFGIRLRAASEIKVVGNTVEDNAQQLAEDCYAGINISPAAYPDYASPGRRVCIMHCHHAASNMYLLLFGDLRFFFDACRSQ